MRWAGDSVGILASGPSLTQQDAAHARAHLDRIITINESWQLCTGADVVYGADSAWWLHRGPTEAQFPGERWTQDAQWHVPKPAGLHTIKSRAGCAVAPPGADYVFTGHNSSFQALGLAVIWGASRVVFLGLDLSPAPDGTNHWHGDHKEPCVNSRSAYPSFVRAFETVAPALAERGVRVINASSRTALQAFERMTIEEACAT